MAKISPSVMLLFICISGYGQTTQPSIQQKSTNSPCSNINASGSAIINCPQQRPAGNAMGSLHKRTTTLARQILDFAYAREGQISDWKQQAIAQAFLDPNSEQEFHTRLNNLHNETRDIFIKQYWPQVSTLVTELAAAGVDVSPISRGVATNDPRTVGLMLSVVSARIGKNPPYSRTFTKEEANAVLRGLARDANIEIYAKKDDPNSLLTAETFAAEAKRLGLLNDTTVRPLKEGHPSLAGIHLVVPSADLRFNFESVYLALQECELETDFDVRTTQPYRVFLAFEVWPTTRAEVPHGGMPLIIMAPRKQGAAPQ